jgi:hypothetical protein
MQGCPRRAADARRSFERGELTRSRGVSCGLTILPTISTTSTSGMNPPNALDGVFEFEFPVLRW